MEHLKHDAVTSNKLRYTLFNWILDFVTFFSKNKFNLFMRGTDFVDVFVLLSPFFPIFPSDLICTTQRLISHKVIWPSRSL